MYEYILVCIRPCVTACTRARFKLLTPSSTKALNLHLSTAVVTVRHTRSTKTVKPRAIINFQSCRAYRVSSNGYKFKQKCTCVWLSCVWSRDVVFPKGVCHPCRRGVSPRGVCHSCRRGVSPKGMCHSCRRGV